MDVPILFSNNSNKFKALILEIKSQRVIMTAFLEEMKQQFQSILENLGENRQPRQEVASKTKRKFSRELGGKHSENLREAGKFHRSPMHTEVRYLSPHWRNGGTLENIVGERPNVAMAITPQRIFAQANPLTHLGAYEGGFSFNRGPGDIMQPPIRVNGNRGQQILQLVTHPPPPPVLGKKS